ncbi:MAG: 3-oxoacyl-[acyl-carrier-protein] reductase [Elusimicrobia bacterium CG08_land_8_20_14_0_20_59_10]|nr:MAG: 3-oxoacyl-[acyl-carrier-protein] reductase [Elusimicrobia bacterium CG08_land_8_20_14_0_20_59_10]
MKALEGKTALVTGAARGIGFEIAMLFAAEGAAVALADLSAEESKASAAEIAAKTGARTLGLGLDVSREPDCGKAVGETAGLFGKLDILVNNAGITKDNLVLRMKEADFDAVMAVNLKGSFLMAKAAAKLMLKARAGRIINISSIVGQAGQAGQANYSASKAGLIGLTKSLAREFAPRQVLVNAIAPGFIRTRMTGGLKDEAREKICGLIPLGRMGEPGEVAEAALFLAGGGSAYITGQVLAVNGGLYM